MASKDDLHHLVERLPENEIHAAERFLEYLCDLSDDPVLKMLREAPEDDEPTTAEEDRRAAEAWRQYECGEARPWREVRKELGGE